MKQRILATLMSLCLMVGLLPTVALAEDGELCTPTAVEAKDQNSDNLSVTPEAALSTTVTSEEDLRNALEAASTNPEEPTTITVRGTIELSNIIQIKQNAQIILQGENASACITVADTSGSLSSTTALNSNAMLQFVSDGASLTIRSITLDGNKKARIVYLETGNTLTLEDGGILKNGYVHGGGAVYMNTGSTFTMNGGVIQNNESTWQAGAVYVHGTGSVFTMNGGTLENNTSGRFGGAVYMDDSAVFMLNDGIIQNNTASRYGGAVASYSGGIKLYINGGTIRANSGQYAGGLAIPGGGEIFLRGGLISENTVTTGHCGGVFIGSSTFCYLSGDIRFDDNQNGDIHINDKNRTVILERPFRGQVKIKKNSNLFVTAIDGYTITEEDASHIDVNSTSQVLVLENNTLVAKTAVSVTLEPNYDGETSVIKKMPKGTADALPAVPFSRAGYTFVGWNTALDKTGISYADGEQASFDSNITLYAQWEANQYSIRYELNGGTSDSNAPAIHTYGRETSLVEPTRSGWTFDGWYTDENFSGTAISTLGATTYLSDITLYAKWTKTIGENNWFVRPGIDSQTYTGSALNPPVQVEVNGEVTTSGYTVEYKNNINVGTATATVKVDEIIIGTVDFQINKARPVLSLIPSTSSLQGSGIVTLTVMGLPAESEAVVSCNHNITVSHNQDGTYSATLPNETKDYTFTATYLGDDNHEKATATYTVSVTQYTGGGSSSSGGSGSSNVSGSGDDVSISASGGTVTDAQMESAVKKADKGSTITIKATSSTTVTLPVGGMEDAADNDNDVLLDLRYGEVTLSARAIAGMTDGVSSNDKIKVSVANQTSSKDETISDLLDKGAAVFDVAVEVDGVEIHSFDGTLTITLTVSNLSKISDPHVLHILNNGTKEYYTPDRISGNTITATGIRNLSTFAVIPGSEVPQTNPFTDVRTSDYYYDAVLWAADNGVTGGTSATTFSPNVTVTRAQMVTFLWRAHGSPKATGANPFTDVSTSDYYYDAVLWAVANGVTSGTSADTFGPDAAVTRAQAVTFQWRAAGSPVVSGSSFDDVAADAYYANAVAWAVANGITSGTGGSNFSPDVVVTRAQAVTFLWKELA